MLAFLHRPPVPVAQHQPARDEYGGSLDNRARLLREIIAAIRNEVGRDYVISVRLCGDELIHDGITLDETVAVARLLEADGLIDLINTSIGTATQTLYMIEASMRIRPDYALFIPSAIRKAVRLPVIGVGGSRTRFRPSAF
jgi:2,4-dienoyl-CoA reductase-like NADH-dependent reductase (Old Yellow Enzyme family)